MEFLITKERVASNDPKTFSDALYITEERANDLSMQMDKIAEEDIPTDLAGRIQKIAYICLTSQELAYCVLLHTRWLIKNGIMLI